MKTILTILVIAILSGCAAHSQHSDKTPAYTFSIYDHRNSAFIQKSMLPVNHGDSKSVKEHVSILTKPYIKGHPASTAGRVYYKIAGDKKGSILTLNIMLKKCESESLISEPGESSISCSNQKEASKRLDIKVDTQNLPSYHTLPYNLEIKVDKNK